MSAEGDETRDRRLADLLFAIAGVVALGLIAVSLSVSGGVFDSPSTDAGQATIGGESDEPWLTDNRTGLVGGGSLGAADRNPIGSGLDGSDNPFASRSDDRLFTVETETPTYWRVDGYDRYDNGTWVRTGSYETYDGEISPRGAVTSIVNRSVRLDRDAAVLPSGWQAASVDISAGSEEAVAVSSETGVHTTRADAVGTAYTVENYCYAPDADRLRNAGESYPPSIAERYTQGTDSLSNRTVEVSDELTADANSPYEAAVAIESGLAEDRGYSLETTHDPGTDPVDSFLFETEAGNGEYMASSMVMLLRAQDIPARYVTGYTPGAQVSNTTDAYAVYEVNAHAWVEVYFPGHGWIPFDPTPASDRLTVENTATNTSTGMSETPIRHACPVDPDDDTVDEDDPDEGAGDEEEETGNETSEDDDNQNGDEEAADPDNGSDEDGVDEPEPIEIELAEEDPQPGETVTVRVTRGNDPIEGAIVRFNDEEVGTTNASGTVRATVPYSDRLVVTVSVPSENSVSGGAIDAQTQIHTWDEAVQYRLHPQVAANQTYQNTTRTYALPAAMEVQAEPLPLIIGGELTVQTALNDQPLADAAVFVNGEQVGQTDMDGRLRVTLPAEYDEPQATISIRRGELEAQQTLPVEALTVEAATQRVLALPGQTVAMTVSAGGAPIENATITADGERIGSTDANGTAAVPVSVRPETAVTATYAGTETTTQVENRLVFVAGIVAVLTGMVVGGTVALRRRTTVGDRVQAGSTQLLGRLRQRVVDALFWLKQLPRTIGPDGSGGSAGFWSRLESPLAVAKRLWARRPDAIVASIIAAIAGMIGGVRALFAGLWRGGGSSDTGEASVGGSSASGDDSSRSRSVRRIWTAFVRLVMRRIDPTRTPEEIASAAIERGLPAGPVNRLTDSFRVVEYGQGDPDREAETASAAMTEIESQSDAKVEARDT